jgi:outer membrane protein OmpA-like peptidoglycan-associated protein
MDIKNNLLVVFLLVSVLATAQSDQLRRSIFFDGGSYYIDEQQGSELTRWLDSIPNLLDKYEIQLISHTDPVGGRRYNQWLSQMRSAAVLELLLLNSIPQTKISVKDWGLENPVYSNDSFRGRVMNRRVDVILHPVVF